MKHNQTSITKLGAVVLSGFISTGAAFAATTSSKGGMQTTTDHSAHRAHGDGLPMLAAGVQELSLGGFVNWEDSTAYSLNVSYGRFLTANWLVGVQGSLTGINSDKTWGAGAFGEYNFLTGTQWVPFVRASVGYSNPHEGGDSSVLGVDAGIKYFMRSNLAISLSVGAHWALSGNDTDDGFAKQLNLGLKFYF